MTKTIKLLAGVLVSTILASPAVAGVDYFALDVGQTKAQDACSTAGMGAFSYRLSCNDTATAYRIALGAQVSPTGAVEGSYGYYGKNALGTSVISGVGVVLDGNWTLMGVQVAYVGTLPAGDAFAVTYKIGLTALRLALSSGPSANNFNLTWGFGAQYKLSTNYAIRAQYENLGMVGSNTTTGTAPVQVLSAGLVYNF